MYFENIKWEEYKIFKQKFNNFVLDKQWRETILFDSLLNKNVAKIVNETIEFFDKKPDAFSVNKYLSFIRKASIKNINKAKVEKDTILAWRLAREAYAYYGIGEVITEGSTYSEEMPKELCKVYGVDYLQKIEELDKIFPSSLTNFKGNASDINIDNMTVKKYLMLKKWQDDQNIYHNNKLYPVFSKCRDKFVKFFLTKFPESKINAREMLALTLIEQNGIINVDTIAEFIDVGINELPSIIGGKNYGLAMLRSKDIMIPQTYILPINNKLHKEKLSLLPSDMKFAVRSSANCEDSKNNSFAGLFLSVIGVKKEDILDSIKKVKESCNCSRVKSYISKFGLKHPNMSVVIQEFIDADISGVWLGKSKKTGILEWVNGGGEKLVSGKVTPITEEFELNQKVDGIKFKGKLVGDILKEHQKTLGAICDFEWCIKDDKFYMLQYRPVTKIIAKESKNVKTQIVGTPASKGIVEGNVCFLEDSNEINLFKKGSILLTYYTDPDWVDAMIEAKAIVTAEGGFLCHTAIIARELGLPCVTGIGEDNLLKLAKYDRILVNGNNGGVDIVKK